MPAVMKLGREAPAFGTVSNLLHEPDSEPLDAGATPESRNAPHDSMTGHRFLVSCLHCKRIVAIAGGIIDAEQVAQLCAHLLACCPGAVDAPSPAIEITLRHFRVVPLEADGEPPPQAA
jgi:hypothetical protein